MPQQSDPPQHGGKPRVYISYTWHPPENKDLVNQFADRLRAAGVDVRIDRYYADSLYGFEPPDEWKPWAQEQVRAADSVILMCSPGYADAGRLSAWDVECMVENLNSGQVDRRKFIPVGFGPFSVNSQYAPASLFGELHGKALYYDLSTNEGFDALIRRIKAEFRKQHPRKGIFVSYSHKDKKLFEEFKTLLAPAIQKGIVDLWDDTRIQPGQQWKNEIDDALASARVAVLLVSENFLASPFITSTEVPPLLKAAQEDAATIFWVCLCPCLYQHTEIEKYQAAHDVSKPLDQLKKPQRKAVWTEICNKLLQVAGNP